MIAYLSYIKLVNHSYMLCHVTCKKGLMMILFHR